MRHSDHRNSRFHVTEKNLAGKRLPSNDNIGIETFQNTLCRCKQIHFNKFIVHSTPSSRTKRTDDLSLDFQIRRKNNIRIFIMLQVVSFNAIIDRKNGLPTLSSQNTIATSIELVEQPQEFFFTPATPAPAPPLPANSRPHTAHPSAQRVSRIPYRFRCRR